MFTNFCTPIRFNGVFEVCFIDELKEFQGNKNIKIKVTGVRKRMENNNKVYMQDSIYLKFWGKSATFVQNNISIGDILDVQGEIRGNAPNLDFRAVNFEILTPTDSQMEEING